MFGEHKIMVSRLKSINSFKVVNLAENKNWLTAHKKLPVNQLTWYKLEFIVFCRNLTVKYYSTKLKCVLQKKKKFQYILQFGLLYWTGHTKNLSTPLINHHFGQPVFRFL